MDQRKILLVGPNGFGKSTLIKLFFGLQRPTEGSLSILNLDPTRDEEKLRRDVSYLSSEPAFPPYLLVRDLYDFMSSFTSLNEIERVEESLYISHLKNRYTKSLSSGEKQLLNIVLSFSQNKKAYLMDESLSSIDPHRKLAVIELLHRFKGGLIITTHEMTELISVTEQILIITRGKGKTYSEFELKDASELPLLISSRHLIEKTNEIASLGKNPEVYGPLLKIRGNIKETMNLIGEDILFAKRDYDE